MTDERALATIETDPGGAPEHLRQQALAIAEKFELDLRLKHLMILGKTVYILTAGLAEIRKRFSAKDCTVVPAGDLKDMMQAQSFTFECTIIKKDGSSVNAFGHADPKDVTSIVRDKGTGALMAMAQTRARNAATRAAFGIAIPSPEECNEEVDTKAVEHTRELLMAPSPPPEPTMAQEQERLTAARGLPTDALPPGEFPEADPTDPEPVVEGEEVGPPCKDCGGETVKKATKSGGSFWACKAYCQRDKDKVPPTEDDTCPNCNSALMVHANKTSGDLFISCTGWRDGCKYSYNDVPDGLKKGDIYTRTPEKPPIQNAIVALLKKLGLPFEYWFQYYMVMIVKTPNLDRNTFWDNYDRDFWKAHYKELDNTDLCGKIRTWAEAQPVSSTDDIPF